MSRNMQPRLPFGGKKDHQRHAQDLSIRISAQVLSEEHLMKVLCHQLQERRISDTYPDNPWSRRWMEGGSAAATAHSQPLARRPLGCDSSSGGAGGRRQRRQHVPPFKVGHGRRGGLRCHSRPCRGILGSLGHALCQRGDRRRLPVRHLGGRRLGCRSGGGSCRLSSCGNRRRSSLRCCGLTAGDDALRACRSLDPPLAHC